MTVPAAMWEQVRQRAGFGCEFCGVTDTDTGGQLTVDHFQPKGKKGSDNLENLIYACVRCNLYKADYFPENQFDQKPRSQHLTIAPKKVLC